MSEMDENDWRALISSPRVLIPSSVGDELESKPQVCGSLKVEGMEEQGKGDQISSSDVRAGAGITVRGSIAERRAAKCGFNAVRISTPRFRTTSPLASPAARSPCLTIPPGISPTALLDSPIMLANSQAQPSPTTGSFQLPPLNHECPMLNPVSSGDGNRSNNVGSSFRFKPHGNHIPFPHYPGLESEALETSIDYQPAEPANQSTNFEFPVDLLKEANAEDHAIGSPNDLKISSDMIVNANCIPFQTCHSDVAPDQFFQQKEPIDVEDVGTHNTLEGEQREACPTAGIVRSSEDGYNWRKYGQKQVKGSEYPRSYYKCTHPNCQVKKKVERSHDGQITEIIYKAAHNHPKPQPSRRSALGSGFSSNEMAEMAGGSGSCDKAEGWSVSANFQPGSREIKVSSNWRGDGLERTSSTSVVTDLSDPISTTQGKSVGAFESADTPELSSTLASHDDEEDQATQGSISLGDDADEDESESKRRKKESCLIEANLSSRAVREPRVVVQIESDVDILDDGYRWRKYGQKVVKGNPNPRSYYKCTSAGCSVRKHVERASHNLKSVITTYEGKHNHEVPAARNSSQSNSNGANLPPPVSHASANLTLPRNATIAKPETSIQDLVPHFERKPEFNTDFLRPSFFGNDMKFGASSLHQMRFPPLQNPMPYGSFGLNPNITSQTHSMTHVPDFPMSMPMGFPQSANVGPGSFDFNSHGKPISLVQPLVGGQQLKETDMRFIRPKQEQKDENLYGTNASSTSSSSASLYCQIMGSYP
uniref:WRKY transcription factor 12 n=1 Tax=Santalum album TaxID=35974 RepID=A0A650C3B5_SANAL|nr:WRKY transcription factor 12 [Santalum album]